MESYVKSQIMNFMEQDAKKKSLFSVKPEVEVFQAERRRPALSQNRAAQITNVRVGEVQETDGIRLVNGQRSAK